jgi:superfamily I DNA/RNA helicase
MHTSRMLAHTETMRVLLDHRPTAEQLTVITDASPGITLIRGAAGSGKTSTAIWRLKFILNYWLGRVRNGHVSPPIRILVLTFNRTLRGYIKQLARTQVTTSDALIHITTFGRWGHRLLGRPQIMTEDQRHRILGERLNRELRWHPNFVVDEVDYILGRYLPETRDRYITDARLGRGSPKLNGNMKRYLLQDIISPYEALKQRQGTYDWQDEAVELAQRQFCEPYHVILVDETQDFSANQIRAVLNHSSEDSTTTFVLDAAQRIYPHSFLWSDLKLNIPSRRRFLLRQNHRNTRQIAALCQSLIEGLDITDDGTMPNFANCNRDGPKPILFAGAFSLQMNYMIPRIREHNNAGHSTAILHPLGGGWFKEVIRRLDNAKILYSDISGQAEWPPGNYNVALSTMASSKGLEFDNLYIVGLNSEVTPHGTDEDDDLMERWRRLLAMAAGRARQTVTIGFKPEDASDLISIIDPTTYELRS